MVFDSEINIIGLTYPQN